tara:strand:+ start:2404 stop:2886 length:483 start_codon:yes stop_codon:yes gene_type:complete
LKKIQTDLINKLGIGAFAFISISEFCGLMEYLFENVLIITKTEPKMIMWLPQIMSLILFLILVVWGIEKYSKAIEINTRKTLNALIMLFFGILLLQFLTISFGTEVLVEKYSTEFDIYTKANKGSLILRSYLAYIPLLQYVILVIILLRKRKTVANTVYN